MNHSPHQRSFVFQEHEHHFISLTEFCVQESVDISRLPYSKRILLENLLRNAEKKLIADQDIIDFAKNKLSFGKEIPFLPARVLMQDFTGVPAVVDLAALRDAVKSLGGDPQKINPLIPVDLVIDHSVQVDVFGSKDAIMENTKKDFQRNQERYEFLKWGSKNFQNFKVVPPSLGIVHQVNLERLARVVVTQKRSESIMLFPDTVVGTDSHTTMINGLAVLGWGVGGIEAEAAMLGQPIYIANPEVIGVRLEGELGDGVTATDLVLTITEKLRNYGVVDKFVEFFGPGMSQLSLADRATIANMAPEYGATVGYFPIDHETLTYLHLTGRQPAHVSMVESYAKLQSLLYGNDSSDPEYSDVIAIDMRRVRTSIAGPKRPQERMDIADVKRVFSQKLTAPLDQDGYALTDEASTPFINFEYQGVQHSLTHGSVVIAAITSCTNTSNPSVMLAAGLLAKKAVERGLSVRNYIKTSLAPGSRVVTSYLESSGLLSCLEQLGFYLVGYGCTTCIGNSGPLDQAIVDLAQKNRVILASVLSGNRNFEGRVHPATKANFLASPPLVVAYALSRNITIDFEHEPLGKDTQGTDVFLRDIWPSQNEIQQLLHRSLHPKIFIAQFQTLFSGNTEWSQIKEVESDLYTWNPESTYIKRPPFFENGNKEGFSNPCITNVRVLVMLGDSITTDHISPAGAISNEGPTAEYLRIHGVCDRDFHSFGARRGNHEVMMRGTFANARLKNLLVPGSEGGVTTYHPTGEVMNIYDAAMKYRADGTPLIVIAGKDYGMGSSRDWAAKGPALLGVKAVIFESVERIHRSNLIGMGILPLEFMNGDTRTTLDLNGTELYEVRGWSDKLAVGMRCEVVATSVDGQVKRFPVLCRIDTPIEIEYYQHGGILHFVLHSLFQKESASDTTAESAPSPVSNRI